MKKTISESEFRDSFQAIRPDNFSYAGLGELFEYFEQLGDDIGEEIELDVIAICCDYSECTQDELETDYGYLFDKDDKPGDLEEWTEALSDRTQVIPVSYSNSIAPEMNTESLIIQAF